MKIGEKYILEIERILEYTDGDGNERRIAKVKGFNSLMFDDVGLGKLEKLEDLEKEAEVDWSKVPVGTLIEVSDHETEDEDEWIKIKRPFACYLNGLIYAFTATEYSPDSDTILTPWKYGRLI